MITITRIFGMLAFLIGTLTGIARADNFVIGLPKDFAGDRKALEVIISTAFTSIKAGDTLSIYSAADQRRLVQIALPADEANNNPRLRTKLFAGQLSPVGPFLASATSAQVTPPSNIGFPQFLRELANTALPALPGRKAEVMVIGSAKYHDPREPRFSTLEGHFPGDGHLRADDAVSPFGAAGRANALKGVNVHLCVTDTTWVDELHRQRMMRFWALYVEALGGKLATFTPDLTTCTQRFLNRVTDLGERFTVDARQTKTEMIRIRRQTSQETTTAAPVPVAAVTFEQGSLFMNQGVAISATPPTNMVGRAKVGIRWDCTNCDLDLYARANPNSPFLFWANQVSAEGRHNKDWLSSPDAENQHEYIDFPNPVDLNRFEVFLHFYAGRSPGGARGLLRIWFENKVYERPFVIAAQAGTERANRRPDLLPSASDWLRIDVRQVVGLVSN